VSDDDLDGWGDELPDHFDLMRELHRHPSPLLIDHLEPKVWVYNQELRRTMFRCPECQKVDAAVDDSDDFVWWCECSATGNRFGLIRRVHESPDALRRAVAHIPGAFEAIRRGDIR
jgi:hypothetical protein